MVDVSIWVAGPTRLSVVPVELTIKPGCATVNPLKDFVGIDPLAWFELPPPVGPWDEVCPPKCRKEFPPPEGVTVDTFTPLFFLFASEHSSLLFRNQNLHK